MLDLHVFVSSESFIGTESKNICSLLVIPAIIVGISLAITRTKGYGNDD